MHGHQNFSKLIQLTLDFYIEGLFLSSGIIRNPDYTVLKKYVSSELLIDTSAAGGRNWTMIVLSLQ